MPDVRCEFQATIASDAIVTVPSDPPGEDELLAACRRDHPYATITELESWEVLDSEPR